MENDTLILWRGWNRPEYSRRSLASLFFTVPEADFVFVDSGSEPALPMREWVTDDWAHKGSLSFVRNEGPCHGSDAINAGLAAVWDRDGGEAIRHRYKYWIVVDNDVEAFQGWLQALTAMVDADPKIGRIGAVDCMSQARDRRYARPPNGTPFMAVDRGQMTGNALTMMPVKPMLWLFERRKGRIMPAGLSTADDQFLHQVTVDHGHTDRYLEPYMGGHMGQLDHPACLRHTVYREHTLEMLRRKHACDPERVLESECEMFKRGTWYGTQPKGWV